MLSACPMLALTASVLAQCDAVEFAIGAGGDDLGRSVAMSGPFIAAGDPNFDRVVIWRLDSRGLWTQSQVIESPSVEADRFGTAVDLQDDLLLVGAPWGGTGGLLYVYRFTETWALEAQLEPEPLEGLDGFGKTAVITPTRAFGGAPSSNGAVFVFESRGEKWTASGMLQPADADARSLFGLALDASGNRLVASSLDARRTFLFELVDGQWSEVAELDNPKKDLPTEFGANVSILQDTCVVTAPTLHPGGGAYVYRRDGDDWLLVQELTPPGGAQWFGSSVELLSEGRVAIGDALGSGPAPGQGVVTVFEQQEDGVWAIWDQLLSPTPSVSAYFGRSLAGESTRLVVGSPRRTELAGSAYFFDRVGMVGCRHEDITGDGVVDVSDLLELIGAWGPCPGECPPFCSADVSQDCVVDTADLLALLAAFD